MAFIEVKNFKSGLDTRRPAIVGEAGSLMECENAHVMKGGDIESVMQMTPYFTLPAGTLGWHEANEKAYVFGTIYPAPIDLPGNIVYQFFPRPSFSYPDPLAPVITKVHDTDTFDGKVYAIVEYDDGSIYHWFDGAHVTDWDSKAAAIMDNSTITSYLTEKLDALPEVTASFSGLVITVTSAVAGVDFTCTSSATGTGVLTTNNLQLASAAVAEVQATASFTITGGAAGSGNEITTIMAGATNLISAPIPFVVDAAGTALACVAAIKLGKSVHGYDAAQIGPAVIITAPVGQGAVTNGLALTVTPDGLVTVGSINNFAGGITAAAAKPKVTQLTVDGTAAVANVYSVVLNGVTYKITGLSSGMARVCKTFASKMMFGVRALLIFSAVDDPTSITTGTGIGTINIGNQDQGTQRITAFGVYQKLLAIYLSNGTQLWAIDPDPDLDALMQLIPNVGTRSVQSVLGFGAFDTMSLADTGIRSLRAQNISNSAAVDDIGTKIDDDVQAFLKTLTDAEIEGAISAYNPVDGRVWVAIDDRIYVFSYFPGSQISAWGTYRPGFSVQGIVVAKKRMYVRSGDQIYLYGGEDNNTYPDEDEIEVRVRLPFLDTRTLAGFKALQGLDLIVEGEWTVEILRDPRNYDDKSAAINLSGPTTLLGRIELVGCTTHFAPLLTSSAAGKKTLSSVAVHYEGIETT